MGMADYTNRVRESVLRRGVVGPCGTHTEPHRLAWVLPVGCGKVVYIQEVGRPNSVIAYRRLASGPPLEVAAVHLL
jgi:hypothetical protein